MTPLSYAAPIPPSVAFEMNSSYTSSTSSHNITGLIRHTVAGVKIDEPIPASSSLLNPALNTGDGFEALVDLHTFGSDSFLLTHRHTISNNGTTDAHIGFALSYDYTAGGSNFDAITSGEIRLTSSLNGGSAVLIDESHRMMNTHTGDQIDHTPTGTHGVAQSDNNDFLFNIDLAAGDVMTLLLILDGNGLAIDTGSNASLDARLSLSIDSVSIDSASGSVPLPSALWLMTLPLGLLASRVHKQTSTDKKAH